MAKENIMKFLEAAIGNRTLADKLSALAGEHGYQFTAEELQSLAAATPADKIFRNGGGNKCSCKGNSYAEESDRTAEQTILSDEETANISGGVNPLDWYILPRPDEKK